MPKRRTLSNAFADTEKYVPGEKFSEFIITINPQKSFRSKYDEDFREMNERLLNLGDTLLSKKTILSLLVFDNDRSYKHNISMIKEIDPDRFARTEVGDTQHRLHLHVTFWITHYTRLQIDERTLRKIISVHLHQPKNEEGRYPFHVNIRGNGRNISRYVKKYDSLVRRQ